MEKQPKRILVIKLRHLGDVLLSSPVFTALQEAYPDALIDAYIWKEASDILLGHPAIANCHLHDRGWKKLSFLPRFWKEWGLLRKIRREKYDLVVNLTEGDRGAIAALVSGAKIKVGVDPGKKWTRKIYTDLVKACPTDRHTVERDLDAVRKLKIFPKPTERDLFFYIPKEAKAKALELTESKPYVVVHAPARWKFKCLPPQLMADICNRIGERVVLTGAPNEKEFVEEVAKHIKGFVLNLAGKTDLKEMGALLLHSKGLITVDSVALHMASALKVPVVALFGPTSELNWGPWMHSRAAVVTQELSCRPCRLDGCGGSKMSDCLWTLSSQEVVDAFVCITSEETPSAASLRVLNSLEMNRTE
ncbi:MAG: putative lipopolysaccharide heptosyltransferase III [Simkaniaceae bacterium]|nr:putative lipopolysaccharide heptosyltransferase III [Candidatus Sacchlamyda saccharinae]